MLTETCAPATWFEWTADRVVARSLGVGGMAPVLAEARDGSMTMAQIAATAQVRARLIGPTQGRNFIVTSSKVKDVFGVVHAI